MTFFKKTVYAMGLAFLSQSVSADSTGNGKVVFHSDRDGNSEIYSISVDGSGERRLTTNSANDSFPSWSPDGNSILFTSDRGGEPAIFIMDSDGSDSRLIPNTTGGFYPKWSHNGQKIAFFAERDGNTDIFVINPDGSNLENITDHSAVDETPSWTLDGGIIAFQSDRTKLDQGNSESDKGFRDYDIFTMASDGSDVKIVVPGDTNDENPSISPDGKKVVYQSYVLEDGDPVALTVTVTNVETGEKTTLTDPKGVSGSPAWSSDGQHIVFDSNRDGNFEIFVMDADGSNQRQLTFTDKGENSGSAMYAAKP